MYLYSQKYKREIKQMFLLKHQFLLMGSFASAVCKFKNERKKKQERNTFLNLIVDKRELTLFSKYY